MFEKIWRTESVNAAKFSNELFKAVKSQSNVELAGFFRNISKYSASFIVCKGQATVEVKASQELLHFYKLKIVQIEKE